MFEEKVIKFKKDGGPITIEIKAMYATLGSYSSIYSTGTETKTLGNGKLGDSIPDLYILPVSIKDLPECDLVISGTYVPSPGHQQISVQYLFMQDGLPAKGDNPINIEKKQEALSCTHSVWFEEATS
jgi:hypothetical protein